MQYMRSAILISADAVSIAIAIIGGFWLRCNDPDCMEMIQAATPLLLAIVPIGVIIFKYSKMYKTLWRYASLNSIYTIIVATASTVIASGLILRIFGDERITIDPQLLITQLLLMVAIVGSGRFFIRFVKDRIVQPHRRKGEMKRLLIYGAGDAGEMLVRDILRSEWVDYKIVGFVDDDPSKHGKSIHDVMVLGSREIISDLVNKKQVNEVLVAMPSLSGQQIREVLNLVYKQVNRSIKLMTVPGTADLIDGKVSFQQVREFNVSDLLRREPVTLDPLRVANIIKDNTVLISGGGGSIGSEICRQVASFAPKSIVIVEISEPSAYEIQQELTSKYPEIPIQIVVGDCGHRQLMENVFQNYRPEIVFHAAAYKHVPLMEDNPWSAVYNNIRGTLVLAHVSAKYRCDRFVMISTDKAVRPTSVMGATKRICEMIVLAMDHAPNTVFCAVRFGNVMGSSGSVIPRFEKQIRAGGPVTVTDKKMTRYFMLTSEAVQLVMQAATIDKDRAIYVLDMGYPVKIDDIAREMILLSGKQPERDIQIVYTGLRPGEKLYEELHHSGNGEKTEIDKIIVDYPLQVESSVLFHAVDDILEHCHYLNRSDLIKKICALVPDFTFDQAYLDYLKAHKYNRQSEGDIAEGA